MSKEHIFPVWMHPYLPKTRRPNHSHRREILRVDGPDVVDRKRSGEPYSGALRIVCAACNNGWMSKLQDRAKPILLPLIHGTPVSLNRTSQTTLAAWITMFVMVAEFAGNDPLFVTSTIEDRRWLMNEGRPPSGWKIWLADYVRGQWVGTLIHAAAPVAPSDPSRAHVPEEVVPNVGSTTFVAGRLFVTAFTSKIPAVLAKQFMQRRILPRLWPVVAGAMAWPPKGGTLSDVWADHIASALGERSKIAEPAYATPNPRSESWGIARAAKSLARGW